MNTTNKSLFIVRFACPFPGFTNRGGQFIPVSREQAAWLIGRLSQLFPDYHYWHEEVVAAAPSPEWAVAAGNDQ